MTGCKQWLQEKVSILSGKRVLVPSQQVVKRDDHHKSDVLVYDHNSY